MGRYRRTIAGFGRRAVYAIAAMLVLSSVLYGDLAYALADIGSISPTNDIIGGGPDGRIWHNLIVSDHGNVQSLDFALYYPPIATGKQSVSIQAGDTCTFNYMHPYKTPNGADIRINTPVRLAMYVVGDNGNKMADGNWPSMGTYCAGGNWKSSMPLTVQTPDLQNIPVDPQTNTKKVILSIRVVTNNPRSVRANGTTTNFADANARFKIQATGAKVGIPGGQSTNNSFVQTVGGFQTGYFPFAMPCGTTTAGMKNVILYDADNDNTKGQTAENPLRFSIEKYSSNGQNLGPVNLSSPSKATLSQDKKVATPIGGTNVNAQVSIWMEPQYKYQLVVKHWVADNFIYIGLPYDEYYGANNTVCPSYNLTPQVSVGPSAVSVGESINYAPTINYSGNMTVPSSEWHVSRVVFQPTGDFAGFISQGSQKFTGNNPLAYNYRDGSAPVSLGSGMQKNFASTQVLPSGSEVANYAVGTRVCYVLTINQYHEYMGLAGNTQWYSSIPACTVIGVKPKIQVLGYDVLSGGKVAGSTSNISGKTYGSWGQQGVFSTKTNVNVASGARLKDGNTSASQSSWSELTFANNTPTYGNYGTLPYPDDTVNKLKSGCTTLPPGDIGNGGFRPGVYCSTSDVTITNNITNPSGSATVKNGSFKQMVIIAPNIIIKDNVTNVDAWLIAGPNSTDEGIVSTCLSSDNRGGKNNPSSAALDAGMCNKKLTITGPVISRKLYLYRTYYDRTKPDDSAEVINVRPDAFLWAYEGAVGDTHASDPYVETQNVTELPPRL